VYCANLKSASESIRAGDFSAKCWDSKAAVPFTGAPITSMQVTLPGSASASKSFSFCVVDFEP
jgi:hypothetical protein